MREDLLGNAAKDTPFVMDWTLNNKSPGTFFNTPATYPVYITALNVAHMVKNGGLNHYIDLANKRSKLLYNAIDSSYSFYSNTTDRQFRSKINVPFRIRSEPGENPKTYTKLEEAFIKEAADAGFVQLRGHASSLGIRVSMYNAMPLEAITKLTQFMADFQKKY